MLTERRLAVLTALINEYVDRAHPVPSKVIVERYGVAASPATVRNDLAALEDEGYVYQPHVSAGRVPTDGGYRAYVDTLASRAPAAVPSVGRALSRAEGDLDDLIRLTAGVLARATGHAAVVVAPETRRTTIRRVTLVGMTPREILVVVVADTGQVTKVEVSLDVAVGEDALIDAERVANELLVGRSAAAVGAIARDLRRDPTAFRTVVADLVEAVAACLFEADAERVVHGGVAALLTQPEFADPREAAGIVGAIEEGVALARQLVALTAEGGTVVRIGRENADPSLASASIVATGYRIGGGQGVVAVVGPTRMDYGRVIGTTATVARTLTEDDRRP
jgi:heat-inducible transcriptional repressor